LHEELRLLIKQKTEQELQELRSELRQLRNELQQVYEGHEQKRSKTSSKNLLQSIGSRLVRIAVLTSLGGLVGGPAIAFALNDPFVNKIIEGAIGAFVGAVGAEAVDATGQVMRKAYRNQLRERLAKRGVNGHQLVEQVAADLMRRGCRPRRAWRLACELTQDEAAARFNQIRGDPNTRMRGSRIGEYEKWPVGGVRPPVRALKILAAIYQTTWDRLVDIDDLEAMPARDRQAFLDISDLRYMSDASAQWILPRGGGRSKSTRA
jgi:hypothetical protein